MIIDVHTHLRGSDVDGSLRELLLAMEKSGVDKAGLIPSPSHKVSTVQVAEIALAHPDKLFAIGAANLSLPPEYMSEQLSLLERMLETRLIRGIKIFTGYDHVFPNDFEKLGPFYEIARRTGFPVIFHTGDTICYHKVAKLKYAQPLIIDDVAVEFPDLKIVIAHLGNPWITDAMAVVQKNKNVYADFSGWLYGTFGVSLTGSQVSDMTSSEHFTKKFMDAYIYHEGAERILFGTDSPVSDMASYVNFTQRLPIPDEEKEKIFWKNAKELFQL